MTTLKIIDLNKKDELNEQEAARIFGGKIRFIQSTRDLHKMIYGDESPYGRGIALFSYRLRY